MTHAAHGQGRLADVAPGGQLRIRLDTPVPLPRLRIEIDGVPVDLPITLQGRTLVVQLPDDLAGPDHDIRLLRRQPDSDIELGYWTFSTRNRPAEASLTGTLEVENRQGRAGSDLRFNGNGRLGFVLAGGALRGGMGFVQTGTSRRSGIQTEVSDYFLESRFALAGQEMRARLGTQSLPAESVLAADALWRGVSLRFTTADGRSDGAVFAISPQTEGGKTNLSGLRNPDNRVAGVAAQIFPFGASSFRADVLAFDGRADLDGKAGTVRGGGLRLSGPIGADLGDFALEIAQTDTGATADSPAALANAVSAELGFGLLGAGHANALELRLSTARRGAGFYSALNPDLVADENRNRAELLFQSEEWNWVLSAERAVSNIGHDPGLPTDAMGSYGLDVIYSPYVFTGGFLQGVTFYGSLLQEDQRRLTTPAGGPDPEDFRLRSLSFGMDRFQPDHAWSIGAKLDWLDDLSGAGTSEQRQRIEAAYAFTPDELTTLTLRAEHGRSRTLGDWQSDNRLEMSYAFPIGAGHWSALVEAGTTWVEGDDSRNGGYLGTELRRTLTPRTALLIRADYGDGAEADDLSPDGGWTFGLALRQEFGATSP